MIHINTVILQDKKAQAIVEFSLLVVLAVVTFVIVQGYVNRAIQGRMRSSADSLGIQFSAGFSNYSLSVVTDMTEEAHTEAGVSILDQEGNYQTIEQMSSDSYAVESAEL